MTSKKNWIPDRRDLILIESPSKSGELNQMLVLSPKSFNERTGTLIGLYASTDKEQSGNPFAIELSSLKGAARHTLYVLGNSPATINWHEREAMPHALKQAPEDVFVQACETLNQIIEIGE